MKRQDILLSIIILITVAAAVLFFLRGFGPAKKISANTASVSASASADLRAGDKICYAAAIDPGHLKESKALGLTYADNEMIVQLADILSENEAAALAVENGAKLVGFINASGTCQWRFSKERSLDDLKSLADQLAKQPEIEFASINMLSSEKTTGAHPRVNKKSSQVPNESRAFNNIANAHWGYTDIHAKAAYDARDKMKTPVNVGILDSGFIADSDELGNLHYNCTVYEGADAKKVDAHGSHVAGIAVAANGNENGIAGVYPCPDSAHVYCASWASFQYDPTRNKTVIEKISEKLHGEAIDAQSLMEYLCDFAWFFYHGVKVVNCSFGLTNKAILDILEEKKTSDKVGDLEYYSLQLPAETYTIFFDRFIQAGYEFLVVTTAGNTSDRYLMNKNVVDARYASVLNYITKQRVANRIIVVGAYNKRHQIYVESNLGSRTDIVAPGVNIYSTVGNGKYEYKTGTSMAAPYVTGTIASLWSLDSSRSAQEVRALLLRTGTVMEKSDYIIDGKSAASVLRLDVKKSMDLALAGGTKDTQIMKQVIPEITKEEGSEVVQIRVFRQTDDSYEEIKTANVTVTGEDGTVYYSSERIAYPAEEELEYETDKFRYYGTNSAFFLALPKGLYQIRIDVDGAKEPIIVEGLDPQKNYYEEEGLRKLVRQFLGDNFDNVPQWDFVTKTETNESLFDEYIKQNFHFIPTGNISSVPSSAWTGAESSGWTSEDITGVLSLDIADYDKDKTNELFVLSLETRPEFWYDKPIQTTYLIMQMYEIRGIGVELSDEKRIAVSKSFLQNPLMVSDQMNCFTFENKDAITIVLDCHQWCEENAQTVNIFEYDGKFRYKKGIALLAMGEGDYYFWTARKESVWLSMTQALEILNDQSQWGLQEYYLVEEHDWKLADSYTIEKTTDQFLGEINLTRSDERIYTTETSSDFTASFNRIHALTAKDVYGNSGLKGYHFLCTLFTRRQLDQNPEWTLIRVDESLANAYR